MAAAPRSPSAGRASRLSVGSDHGWGAAESRPPLLVDARRVDKRYGDTIALDGVCLWVRAGAVVGLVGPNGSGKTTALRIVAGLERPDGGRVDVGGSPAGSRVARSMITFVPDEPVGFDELTVGEYAALLAALHDLDPADRHLIGVLAEAFSLSGRIDARLGDLSKGQRRKASLVAGLGLARPVALVDEATATLDPEAAVALRAILRAHALRGGAALLATQDLHFAEISCDVVVLLGAGRILAQGAPQRLLARHGASHLEDVFLAVTGNDLLQEAILARLAAV